MDEQLKNIIIGVPIGDGGTSDVYSGIYQKKVAALKIMKTHVNEPDILREFEMSKRISEFDESFPRFYALGKIGSSNIIVNKKFETSLLDKIEKLRDKGKKFSEKEIIDFSIVLCNQLYKLHENNIAHRDVKSNNILLSRNKTTLCDFSTCYDLNKTFKPSRYCGTKMYWSPELYKASISKGNYEELIMPSDVYALGLVIKEMMTLEVEWEDNSEHSFESAEYSQELNEFVNNLLKPLEERPDIKIVNEDVKKLKNIKEYKKKL